MNRGSLDTVNAGGAMVKAVTRKARAFQTLGEKSYSLDAHETRLRERLFLINRFEDARLERLQRQITSNERANVGRILRRKDQMRVSLIDIASTKRKIQSNVGEFEKRLKNGTNSPVFAQELERIRRKEQELVGLHQRLQAPNSQLLAAHLRDELRSIESRLDASPSRLNPTQPPSVADNYAAVKLENQHETGASLSSSQSNVKRTATMPASSAMEERLKEVHAKMSRANISPSKSPATSLLDEREHHFPLTQQTHTAESIGPGISPIRNRDGEQLRDVPIEHNVIPVEMPVRELPPLRVAKTKKQKYLTLMQHKLARTSHHHRDQEISNSALQRERHAKKRMAELRVKTCVDIKGRKTVDSDESLGSIKLQETVTRLQTTRKGSTLPSVGKEEAAPARARHCEISRAAARRRKQRLVPDSAVTAVTLPPIRIDVGVLKELKDSRRRHRSQSQKLPKLP